MKNENKITFAILKEKISPDNVLAMSELIAISETKYLIGYMGARMQKIHMDLYIDIMHKNDVNHILRNAYDLVQECGLFLCQHFGAYLKDVIGYHTSREANADNRATSNMNNAVISAIIGALIFVLSISIPYV